MTTSANLTTAADIEAGAQTYYNQVLLARVLPYLPHGLMAQRTPLPMNSGEQAKFRRYESLGASTAPIRDGVNPDGRKPTKTDVLAEVYTYGDFIYFTDKCEFTNQDKVLNEFTKQISEQASLSLDTIWREVMVNGSQVQYADNVLARTALDASLDGTDIKRAVRTLQNANAKPVDDVIEAGTGQDTSPIREAYWGIMHPDVYYDVDESEVTGWVDVSKYANIRKTHEREYGAYKEARFIGTTNAKYWADAATDTAVGTTWQGTTYANAYSTMLLARDYYGIIDLAGHALELIYRSKEEIGGPLKLFSSVGWKAYTTAIRLNELFAVRLESLAKI
jgi:N4-gp56 family major capsid protein